MTQEYITLRFRSYFLAMRPMVLTASAAPVIVGSSLGLAVTGEFSFGLFALALGGIVCIQAGANMANDYYDHLSGNDWANKTPTPFSGGSRLIQNGDMSPRAMLAEAIVFLAAGAGCGVVILVLTRSVFIFALGLIGLSGAFFYSARPVKLCYRGLGEITIAFLFGILPVAGAYYLQAGRLDWHFLAPGVIVGLLIFLIILVNEFPDLGADASAGKKTLVVKSGVPVSVSIYRTAVELTYVIALAGIFMDRVMLYAGGAYLLTLPLGIYVFRLVNAKQPPRAEDFRANAATVWLHTAGAAALTIGFIAKAAA